MHKKEIYIFDNYLAGKQSTSYDVNVPLNFRWRHLSEKYCEHNNFIHKAYNQCVVYTDDCVMRPEKIGKYKIAWMLEPMEYAPTYFNYIKDHYNEFDIVLTWDKRLLDISDKFVYYPPANSWIKRDEIGIYPKNKLLSISASWKKFMSGHAMRHEIIDNYMKKYNIHWYGKRGFTPDTNVMAPFDATVQNPVDNLLDAYKDYMFTIVVENAIVDYMFTEKLISPILSGTIPIYCGCPNITEIFDERGMIIFNSVDELDQILLSLSEEKYYDMLPYARSNFEKAKQYQLIDDAIYDKLVELNYLDK